MDPTNRRWRLAKAVMPGRFIQSWLGDLLDALPQVVRKQERTG
jgi:hypothetical protein